jgi:hypothetical protein
MSELRIGCKRLILKLSEVLIIEEVEGPYMFPNERLIPIQKWYDPRDIQTGTRLPELGENQLAEL